MTEESFAQRRARFVRMAAVATKLSTDKTDLQHRESCLDMAGSWLKLARAAECAAAHENKAGAAE